MRRLSILLKKAVVLLVALVSTPFVVPVILIRALACRATQNTQKSPRLVWGPTPAISNKYWSHALAKKGWFSRTLMFNYYSSINKRDDFDLYVLEIIRWPLLDNLPLLGKLFKWSKRSLQLTTPYISFVYALANFDIFHHPYSGGFLGLTPLWRLEAFFLKLAKKKVIVLPYGGDFYRPSHIVDTSLRHGLLLSYPEYGREEDRIGARVDYWTKHASAVIPGFQIDGLGRWDVLPFIPFTIDADQWRLKETYSGHDGVSGTVKVIHTPNHRGFKGTEFLVRAIEELQEEGLKVELILVEKRSNEEVRRLMAEEADVLAEQFIATGYAMSGIEGMASGLPVMANLEHEAYTRVFRRYSYLNECPILSTTPETMKENLRVLVINPELREELGRAGRLYVEKYHSEETACYMFGAVYEKIWHGKDEVDLMNLFHPLKSEYNRRRPLVEHPLVDSKLPMADERAKR
jgi:glycosyltransferase involved in cell wall biosynthesis